MLPDTEALTLAYLRSRPELAGITFGTLRPADLARRLPFALIERIGGAADTPSWRGGALLDRAGIAVQVWAGPDRADARALIHRITHTLSTARAVPVDDGVIVQVTSLTGPTSLPDPAAPDGVHRFTASVQITTRARTNPTGVPHGTG